MGTSDIIESNLREGNSRQFQVTGVLILFLKNIVSVEIGSYIQTLGFNQEHQLPKERDNQQSYPSMMLINHKNVQHGTITRSLGIPW